MKVNFLARTIELTAEEMRRASAPNAGKYHELLKIIARQDPNFKDGRPKKFTPEQIALALSLLDQGKTYRQITSMTGISKSTLIRAKKQGA